MKKSKLVNFFILLPFILHVVLFVIYPTINVFVLSFKQDYNYLTGEYSSIGMENYIDVLGESVFWSCVINTLKYALIVVPITLIVSVVIALMLNKKIRFISFFQTSFFLPMVTATTAVSYSWRLVFNSQYGILNYIIELMGGQHISWLSDPKFSLLVLCVNGIWNMLPFSILTVLGTLQTVNPEYYISAAIDGAGSVKVFKRITLPTIAPSIFLLGILHTISSFRVFDELFPLFSGKPGPCYNLYTIVFYMYEQMQTFSRGSYGRAAVVSVFLLVLLFFFSSIAYFIRKIFMRKNM